MTFDEVLDQVRDLLQQRGRVTYRSFKLRFQLDDEMLHGVVGGAERILSLGPFDDKSWAKWLEYLNNTFIQEDARKKDAKLKKEDAKLLEVSEAAA